MHVLQKCITSDRSSFIGHTTIFLLLHFLQSVQIVQIVTLVKLPISMPISKDSIKLMTSFSFITLLLVTIQLLCIVVYTFPSNSGYCSVRNRGIIHCASVPVMLRLVVIGFDNVECC